MRGSSPAEARHTYPSSQGRDERRFSQSREVPQSSPRVGLGSLDGLRATSCNVEWLVVGSFIPFRLFADGMWQDLSGGEIWERRLSPTRDVLPCPRSILESGRNVVAVREGKAPDLKTEIRATVLVWVPHMLVTDRCRELSLHRPLAEPGGRVQRTVKLVWGTP